MQPPKNCTIGIASGKGGVGKTVITANLALSLAQQFRAQRGSVVAIDLDLGCGNLNACLGVRSPNGTINSFLLKKVPDLRQLLTATEQENLQMICSSYSGAPEIRLDDDLKKDLLNKIRTLGANFILMDLGAGTSSNVLDLFLAAGEKIIVITPEALSLHNAFVFLKTLILHFLWRELEKEEFLSPLKSTLQRMITGQEDLNIRKLIDRLKVWDRYSAYIVAGLINDLKIKFVVNMYRGGAEESHLRNFHNLLFRHLCVRSNISYLGFVHFDRGVPVSVQGIRPFLLRYPDNRAAIDMLEVAERLAKEQELYNTPSLHFPKRPWWRSIIPY
ncbi:P-loop NTPase [Acidobacteria bacterium AH-259-G07]|nr:P-loop NTPase [Acidobacteria bacterium AH-259-G07]